MPFDPETSVTDLARQLIGAAIIVRNTGGTIVETEAYSIKEPASHSFGGPRARNAAMFGPPGHAYVYRSYGIHMCLNVVGRRGEAVLIRALVPEIGIDTMIRRRGQINLQGLCSGPGRLGQALGLTQADDGKPFDGLEFKLEMPANPPQGIVSGPRIGISRATDLPWRFGIAGSPWLSRAF